MHINRCLPCLELVLAFGLAAAKIVSGFENDIIVQAFTRCNYCFDSVMFLSRGALSTQLVSTLLNVLRV